MDKCNLFENESESLYNDLNCDQVLGETEFESSCEKSQLIGASFVDDAVDNVKISVISKPNKS